MKTIDYEDLKKALETSKTRTEVLVKLGLNINGGSFTKLRNLLKKHSLTFDEYRTTREEYNKDKRHCLECGAELDFEHRANVFCSSSCAAKHNNRGRKHTKETKEKISQSLLKEKKPKEAPEQRYCEVCERPLTGRQTKYCSKTCKQKKYSHTQYHAKYSKRNDEKGSALKLAYVEKLGGKCVRCGYNKNLSALTFHHLEDKKFTLDARTFNRCPQELLEKELSKCILLCSNCHHEIHHPDWDIEVLRKRYGKDNKK